MSINVKAIERDISFQKDQTKYAYVMTTTLYNTLKANKVIREAALRSGVNQGVMQACWDAAGEVIKAWATEGHNVPIPGLGSMRFSVRARSVENVNDVKTSLIKTRRVIFTPSQQVKDELANTSISITCYDRNGEIVKRVTSADEGDVEDGEENEGSLTPDPSPQGEGSENGSGNSGNGGSSVPTLTISKTGSGTSAVTVGGNAVNSGSQIAAGTEVALSVTPAAGQTPTATLNGSSVTLTESDGTYTGTFQMPDGNATLVINSGSTGGGGADQN